MTTVTQEGVTVSQPGINVSVQYPVYDDNGNDIGGAILFVTRYYKDLKNEWGGIGRSKPLDSYGKLFPTADSAWKWALSHGYIRPYFSRYNPDEKIKRRRLFWNYVAPAKGLV